MEDGKNALQLQNNSKIVVKSLPSYLSSNGKFVYPEGKPFIMTIVGSTGVGKTEWIRLTFLALIPAIEKGLIPVLYLSNSKQKRLDKISSIVGDLTMQTYQDWDDKIKKWIESKKPQLPKLVICDDFTNVINTKGSEQKFREIITTFHNHANTSYIFVSHTAVTESKQSRLIQILKSETSFIVPIDDQGYFFEQFIKSKLRIKLTNALANVDSSLKEGTLMYCLREGLSIFDNTLSVITQ